MSKKSEVVLIANPMRHGGKYIKKVKAQEFVKAGVAYFLNDGRLKFKERVQAARRSASDVYVDRRGALWWNGSDVHGMHRPGEVVS